MSKTKDSKDIPIQEILYHSIHGKCPATLDLNNLLKSSSISSSLVHVEIANTSIDNPYGKPIDHFYDGIYDGKILPLYIRTTAKLNAVVNSEGCRLFIITLNTPSLG